MLFKSWIAFAQERGKRGLAVFGPAALGAILAGGGALASPAPAVTPGAADQDWPRAMEPAAIDAEALDARFAELGYRLADVRDGVAEVPRLFLASLPSDLAGLPSTRGRKALFIRSLLPLVLSTNESIWARRERLLDLMRRLDEGETLKWTDRAWLDSLAEDFGVDGDDLDALRRRVDIVPPSLALAQAAAESGWGTSRFARLGNAVFGQRTWVPGDGLVPGRRDRDKRHEVKSFTDLPGAVVAYMMNLNRHPAYSAFRAERAEMRRSQGDLDSAVLAGTLIRYAEDGRDYVETLLSIIRVNKLKRLDRARLRAPEPETVANPDAGV